jgi:3-deoxy-D-manno-octulosonate 8-phosphate phosphatase (KDO 8-P phosphatase)
MTLKNKIKSIKLLILDVDGVLTDGTFYLSTDGVELKGFHTQDGLGIKQLQKAGITVAIISSRSSKAVDIRMEELGVTHVYQGIVSKLSAYNELVTKLQLTPDQIAYMGDDLPDLPVMEQVGISIAPANAVSVVKKQADWKTMRAGGQAAVREVSDMMLLIRNTENITV